MKQWAKGVKACVCFAFLLLAFACPHVAHGQTAGAAGIKIQIALDKTEVAEGKNVVVSVMVQHPNGEPVPGMTIHARLDGKDWGAEYRTLPSGVAHLVLPMPERGKHAIDVSNGTSYSAPAEIQVAARQFDIVTDPDHLVILEYETWFGPGYAAWGREEATPILGHYSSLDPRVLRQHALWFNEMGINAVELDWTNNLIAPFPSDPAKECIAAMDALLAVYGTMPQHPKIIMLMGPENNVWRDEHDVYAGPNFRQQMNYIYDHYIGNPKYSDMFVRYQGKPLMLYYLNGPRSVAPPDLNDSRFTTRYVGAWLQTTHEERYGAWSWYDQNPVPTTYKNATEALTVTDGYPAVHPAGAGLDNWLALDAGGKNAGETFRTQWAAALKYKPRFLFINQWNEFIFPEQYNGNLSNDLEPTILTESGDPKAGGWGFYYMELAREEIAAYRSACARRQK